MGSPRRGSPPRMQEEVRDDGAAVRHGGGGTLRCRVWGTACCSWEVQSGEPWSMRARCPRMDAVARAVVDAAAHGGVGDGRSGLDAMGERGW
jgi:hypothetical protein